jgi:hypothetical protein
MSVGTKGNIMTVSLSIRSTLLSRRTGRKDTMSVVNDAVEGVIRFQQRENGLITLSVDIRNSVLDVARSQQDDREGT